MTCKDFTVDYRKGRELRSRPRASVTVGPHSLAGHRSSIWCVPFCPTSQIIYTRVLAFVTDTSATGLQDTSPSSHKQVTVSCMFACGRNGTIVTGFIDMRSAAAAEATLFGFSGGLPPMTWALKILRVSAVLYVRGSEYGGMMSGAFCCRASVPELPAWSTYVNHCCRRAAKVSATDVRQSLFVWWEFWELNKGTYSDRESLGSRRETWQSATSVRANCMPGYPIELIRLYAACCWLSGLRNCNKTDANASDCNINVKIRQPVWLASRATSVASWAVMGWDLRSTVGLIIHVVMTENERSNLF